jgi:hypothetical protein
MIQQELCVLAQSQRNQLIFVLLLDRLHVYTIPDGY